MNKKKIFLIAFLVIILAVGVVVGYTSAYFTAEMINSGSSTNTVVTTARMEIEFTDGPEVKLENAMPGTSVEKTFKVKNTGEADTVYDVYMSEVVNDFVDKSDLVYTLTSTDGGKNITETQVPGENTKIVSEQALGVGDEHNYKLKIDFKETNDNQDDNKDKVFTVTVRVNEVKELSNIAVDVIKRITDGSIADDETVDHNLRYIGANPNNYILYNDELWRIIGIMNNIETESGETKSLLKIRRADTLGRYVWNDSEYSVNGGEGVNQWGPSGTFPGAYIMQELNNDYLGNIIIGTNGNWYAQGYGNEAPMPSKLLTGYAQNMIESVVWHTGSPNNDNGMALSYDNSLLLPPYVYAHERANTNGKTCESVNTMYGNFCSDTVERTSTWTGKVGLIYPSDYLYATSGGNTANRATCLGITMYNEWINESYSYCKDNDWLFNGTTDFTMSPSSSSSNAIGVYAVDWYGNIAPYNAGYGYNIYPVLFLKSAIKIVGGTGTSTDPYTLG